MPEPKNPKPRTTRQKTTAKQPPQEKFCHIHDKVCEDKDEIRKNVCVPESEHPLTEFEGKHYCLFHLPSKEKDIIKFNQIFQARLEKTDTQCKGIEAEFPDDEGKQNEAKSKRKIKHDFRNVWFPLKVDIYLFKFRTSADFSSATFNEGLEFAYITFTAFADFRSTTFSLEVDFSGSTFLSFADFRKSSFKKSANFKFTTFRSSADFRHVTFNLEVDFSYTIFGANTFFRSATFEEKSHIYFLETMFWSNVYFNKTEVSGYIQFEGDIFCNAERVKNIRKKLEIPINRDQEVTLDFREIRLKKPERVSFNSTKLRPNWFVNVAEARKIEFNDVEWLNSEIDIDRTGLDKEIESLKKREVSRAEKSLIKACNQLADNAEANRRIEEAKQFRKQGIALQNHECHIGDGIDIDEKGDIREKVCKTFPVVNEYGGKYYCLLHNPDKNKAEIFLQQFYELRSSDQNDFRAVFFPVTVDHYLPIEINNDNNSFTIGMIDFNRDFDYSYAVFQRNFIIEQSSFSSFNFFKAKFESGAELILDKTVCNGRINLDKTVIEGKVFIIGDEKNDCFIEDVKAFSMNDARISNPQFINFQSIRLRPHYFVGVDASKFVFHDCIWKGKDILELSIEDELKYCTHKELARTANQIAVNYEENRNFEESSYFRYLAMETKRTEKKGLRRIFNLYSFYKLTSGYGENWRRAALILFGVLFCFGVFYSSPFATFDYGEKKIEFSNDAVEEQIYEIAAENERFHNMNLSDSLVHSLYVAALQRPEPKAVGFWTKLFVILQTILAPLQAALLALAIRRKFMR